MGLLLEPENTIKFQQLLDNVMEQEDNEVQMSDNVAKSILQNIIEAGAKNPANLKRKNVFVMRWFKAGVAASLILFISSFAYWFFLHSTKDKLVATDLVKNPEQIFIQPGGHHAILTTGDGQSIVLDSIRNGDIISGNSKIKKQGDLLVYGSSKSLKKGTVMDYNTLSTPRGGQYQLLLPDGSKVWLNASSSIRFPTAFIGNERDVQLTGEAYFEIAKNKEKPFHVYVGGMQVEVLGTHFNVNEYDDEGAIKTSLLEGSVKIKDGKLSGMLKPGQQGVLKKNENHIEIKNADMNEVVAWKNGLFEFNGADIESIMRQIGRWYDVEIEYAGKVPDRRFEGKISRDAQLSDVLRILELSNIKFRMQQKKIIVE